MTQPSLRKLKLHLSMFACTVACWGAVPAFAQAPAALPAPATATAAKPAALHVDAKFSNDHPLFGDTVELQVTLTYPTSVRAFFPGKPNLRPLLVDVRNPGKTTRVEQAGKVTETLRIPVLAVRSGLLKTPPIEVPWHEVTAGGGAGESGTVTVPPLRMTVRSQFASENEVLPAPLPPPRTLVEENVPLEIALLVLAMMVIAAVLTLVGLRIYKARAARQQPKQVIAPDVLAYRRLEALLRSGRLHTDEPRQIIGELSEILREYLGGRFRFHALDMTSTELLEALQRVDLRTMTVDEFRDFTNTTDLFKFAGVAAEADDLDRLLGFVRSVVDRTMQTQVELQRLREVEVARLARKKRLRIEVMAPAPLRLRALAIDLLAGALVTSLIAVAALHDGNQSLLLAAYGFLFVWLALRDALGGSSPGKALTGLQIASFHSEVAATQRHWRPGQDEQPDDDAETAQMAPWGARLQRNLLMLLPFGGLVAEALTALALPEQRRLGDQWAKTRVIDGRHGLRVSGAKPSWVPAVALLIATLIVLVVPPLWVRPATDGLTAGAEAATPAATDAPPAASAPNGGTP